jgi:hypothetical protein
MTSCPYLRSMHALHRDLGMILDDADDVAVGHRIVDAEQQIGRGEMEEMQRVRLEHLPQMHQPADLLGRRREPIDTDEPIARLGRGQVMTDRTDPAEALNQHRQLPIGPALDEFLEARNSTICSRACLTWLSSSSSRVTLP